MMFCPKCKAILLPRKEANKTILECKCGFKNKDAGETTFKETIKQEAKIQVVDQDIEAYPLIDVKCEKCNHKKAYFWTIQTRASDEPETKFYKCEKCKFIWRDYS